MATLVLTASLLLVACEEPFHERVEETLAVGKVVIEKAQDYYAPQCKPDLGGDPTRRACKNINKAVDAQKAVIKALDLYCSGPGWAEGGPCNPPKATKENLLAHLRAALADYDGIIAAVQGIMPDNTETPTEVQL